MDILYAIAGISAISTLLSAVIVLMEKYINNYGECTIVINDNERIIKIQGGGSLLTSLSQNDIYIPSACGGKATCGLCKVQVLEGGGIMLPTEEPYLDKGDRELNMRLSCQVKVKGDMKIVVPRELFSIRAFKTEVENIEDLTYDIKLFRLKLLEPGAIEFKAGQYIQVESKPYGKIKESAIRAYSMSSIPTEKDHVELIVRLVPGGVCTTFLHEHLKLGDTLNITGPYGEFYIREGADTLVFIAGGSGLAPIKSMILDLILKNTDKKMIFFFGARSKKDLFYYEFFRELEEKHGNFTYYPALSHPDEGDDWVGDRGLITDVVSKYVPDGINKQAYLCGSPGMLKACIEVLKKMGFSDDTIFYDEF